MCVHLNLVIDLLVQLAQKFVHQCKLPIIVEVDDTRLTVGCSRQVFQFVVFCLMTIEKSQCYVSWEDSLFQDEAKFLKLVNDIFKQNSHPRFFVGKVLFALAEATLLIRVHREHAINIIDHE